MAELKKSMLPSIDADEALARQLELDEKEICAITSLPVTKKVVESIFGEDHKGADGFLSDAEFNKIVATDFATRSDCAPHHTTQQLQNEIRFAVNSLASSTPLFNAPQTLISILGHLAVEGTLLERFKTKPHFAVLFYYKNMKERFYITPEYKDVETKHWRAQSSFSELHSDYPVFYTPVEAVYGLGLGHAHNVRACVDKFEYPFGPLIPHALGSDVGEMEKRIQVWLIKFAGKYFRAPQRLPAYVNLNNMY